MATNLWGRLSLATKSAFGTFRRVWDDPSTVGTREKYEARTSQYEYLWHWYQGTLFERAALWARYKSDYHLYRQIRAIHNPVERLVDFYAGIIYPGRLTTDRDYEGMIAIPLADDVPDELRLALAQLWQWSNWQINKGLMVRYGAALGDAFVEIVDEQDRGKVTFDVMWPGYIAELDLDQQGNVKAYAIEYEFEVDDKTHKYRKEVDAEVIRTYRDDSLFAYDEIDAERDNPYGFAPAVWCKHKEIGGDHGKPALRSSSITKLDEVNALVSHLLDQEHRILETPILVAGEGVGRLGDDSKKAGSTHDLTDPSSSRESIRLLRSGPGGDIKAVTLPEGEALAHIDQLLSKVEEDHPELSLYQQLREMSQVSGPGASRLIGDALIPIEDARANYDQQSVKLFQMAIAIAGWRIQNRFWGNQLTDQQLAFAPFNLESYSRGELNFEIVERPLIQETPMERITRERMEVGLEADRAGGQNPLGIEQRLREA